MKKWSFVAFVFGTFLYGACSTNNEIEVDNVSLNGEQVGFDFSEGNHKFPSMMLGNIFLVRDSVFLHLPRKQIRGYNQMFYFALARGIMSSRICRLEWGMTNLY